LKDADGNLFGQTIQVDTSRMTAAKNVFYQDLRFAQILFIPTRPTTQRIHLNPVFANLSAFLLALSGHKNPPRTMIRFLLIFCPPPVFSRQDCPAGRAMDEESRRENILPGASDPFPQKKAASKGCRETSVEARPV
jgi:hypothetical protein